MTLTIAEIKDLAECAGLVLKEGCEPDADELETEIVVMECPKHGVRDDDGKPTFYAHVAYFEEYPEEGCFPLGDELPYKTEGQKIRERNCCCGNWDGDEMNFDKWFDEYAPTAPEILDDCAKAAWDAATLAEREACAQLVEKTGVMTFMNESYINQVREARETFANAIRARSNEK